MDQSAVTQKIGHSPAGQYSGKEKRGCHKIAVGNDSVIDVEIAFPGKFALPDAKEKSAPRVDLVSVEEDGEDVRLVFWEAKTYLNKELRALGETLAPVCHQIDVYRMALEQHRKDIETSYVGVAANLVAFKQMGWARSLSPLIEAVGRGERSLHIGSTPKVGLAVFGFDKSQRDGSEWKPHLEKLRTQIPQLCAAGDPKNIRL